MNVLYSLDFIIYLVQILFFKLKTRYFFRSMYQQTLLYGRKALNVSKDFFFCEKICIKTTVLTMGAGHKLG